MATRWKDCSTERTEEEMDEPLALHLDLRKGSMLVLHLDELTDANSDEHSELWKEKLGRKQYA